MFKLLIASTMILGVVWIILTVIKKSRDTREKYLALPTYADYIKSNLKCATGKGSVCNVCGSNSIRNWGIDSHDDQNRVFVCNHCNNHLYRSN